MEFETYVCDGCELAFSEYEEWESCDSCGAFYRQSCQTCDATNIFEWNGKKQCRKCNKLFSEISVKSSDILVWFAARCCTTVENIEKEYNQAMLKLGKIIGDSVCDRCKNKCEFLEEESLDDDGDQGVCCICLKLEEKCFCDYCRKWQSTKSSVSSASTATTHDTPIAISSKKKEIRSK